MAELAAGQWGVVDNKELRACGLSANAVMARRRRGTLHAVYPGVYGVGHVGLTLRGRWLAAVKACGTDAALSHRSAAALWELTAWDEHLLPEVTVPYGRVRRIAGIAVHRTRVPFRTLRFDAIPVTTPARTLVDLATLLPYKPLRRAVREAMARKRVTVRELVAIPGRRGGRTLRRILVDGYVPTRSELEDAVHEVIGRGGFVAPAVNHDLRRDALPDFLWRDRRIILEADGREWHDNPLRRQDDLERQARLEALGYRVLRVTWRQAVTQPEQTIARLRAAGVPLSA